VRLSTHRKEPLPTQTFPQLTAHASITQASDPIIISTQVLDSVTVERAKAQEAHQQMEKNAFVTSISDISPLELQAG
jgi:hypothetical protein